MAPRLTPRAMAKKLVRVLRPQHPDYHYLKKVFQHTWELLDIGPAPQAKRLPELPDVPTSTLDFTFLIHYIRCRTSIDVLALDCGGHHDVATAQTSQRLARRLPEPAARHSVA